MNVCQYTDIFVATKPLLEADEHVLLLNSSMKPIQIRKESLSRPYRLS